jgi:hypothetical protein
MAELADALDLGSSAVKGVQVQVLFPAPALRCLVVLGISAAGPDAGGKNSKHQVGSHPCVSASKA